MTNYTIVKNVTNNLYTVQLNGESIVSGLKTECTVYIAFRKSFDEVLDAIEFNHPNYKHLADGLKVLSKAADNEIIDTDDFYKFTRELYARF